MAMHVEESELALTKIERGRNAARYVLFVHLAVAGSSIAATVLILLASSFANPRVGCYASITVIRARVQAGYMALSLGLLGNGGSNLCNRPFLSFTRKRK